MSGEELADRLMDYDQCNESDVDAAAAELKRLSAELARVSRQRDAAREALKEIVGTLILHGDKSVADVTNTVIRIARLALCEETER